MSLKNGVICSAQSIRCNEGINLFLITVMKDLKEAVGVTK